MTEASDIVKSGTAEAYVSAWGRPLALTLSRKGKGNVSPSYQSGFAASASIRDVRLVSVIVR
jgi:hypothetical protein